MEERITKFIMQTLLKRPASLRELKRRMEISKNGNTDLLTLERTLQAMITGGFLAVADKKYWTRRPPPEWGSK